MNNHDTRTSPNESLRGQHHVHFDQSARPTPSALDHALGIVTALIACGCVCGLVTLLCILYVTVRPFSVPVYRRLSAQLGLACLLDALVLLLPSTTIYLTGDSDVPSPIGTSILVSNHLCDGDWWALLMLGRSVGLQGSMKAFLRNEYLRLSVDVPPPGAEAPSPRSSATLSGLASSSSRIASLSNHRTSSDNGSLGGGGGSSGNHHRRRQASPDLSLMAKLLHLFLEFPLVNGEDNIADREHLFRLLRSFAAQGGNGAPVHLVSFPEGWCVHSGVNRQAILAKSNEFAQKEGRPLLKHLLLPRTRNFNASFECLRESNPVVYDVTMAYNGYDGSLAPSEVLSLSTLWDILRRKFPSQIYVRVKRYSIEEVLQDASWLDKRWQEKDRLLSHFVRHRTFPVGSRGYSRHRIFNSFTHSIENSLISLARLLLLPCIVPVLFLLSIPIFWSLICIWLASGIFQRLYPSDDLEGSLDRPEHADGGAQNQTPGSNGSAPTSETPFVPATPFASPSVANWFVNHEATPR